MLNSKRLSLATDKSAKLRLAMNQYRGPRQCEETVE